MAEGTKTEGRSAQPEGFTETYPKQFGEEAKSLFGEFFAGEISADELRESINGKVEVLINFKIYTDRRNREETHEV